MWKCKKCGSNLLDTTSTCPICEMPDKGELLLRDSGPASESHVDSSKKWILTAIGILVPPLGILFLLMNLVQRMAPDEPQMLKVYFDENSPPVECQSEAELDSVLDEIAATCDRPILVDIHVRGFLLQIGLGLDPTFVFISSGHENEGDYVATIGDENDRGVVDVFGCGGHTQIDRRHLIDYSAARQAVRQFIEDGSCPSTLRWQNYAGREV